MGPMSLKTIAVAGSALLAVVGCADQSSEPPAGSRLLLPGRLTRSSRSVRHWAAPRSRWKRKVAARGIKQAVICEGEPTFRIFEFKDAAGRETMIAQFHAGWYVALGDTRAVTGGGDDLLSARNKLGGTMQEAGASVTPAAGESSETPMWTVPARQAA